MTLTELYNMAREDLKIIDIEEASMNNCLLYNKYLKLLTDDKLLLKKLQIEFNGIRKSRYRYYMGYEEDCPMECLNDRGVKVHLDGDDELLQQQKRIAIVEERCRFLENTCASVTARGFNIKNMIEIRKINLGVV